MLARGGRDSAAAAVAGRRRRTVGQMGTSKTNRTSRVREGLDGARGFTAAVSCPYSRPVTGGVGPLIACSGSVCSNNNNNSNKNNLLLFSPSPLDGYLVINRKT